MGLQRKTAEQKFWYFLELHLQDITYSEPEKIWTGAVCVNKIRHAWGTYMQLHHHKHPSFF